MKKMHVIICCLMLFDISFLVAQPVINQTHTERVMVSTDRNMYISGENILFSAFVLTQNTSKQTETSKVINCELITPEGNRISAGKYKIDNKLAVGCLPIPEECITGIYYLKAYTRLMRNGKTEDYSYTLLKIINPENSEFLSGTDTLTSAEQVNFGQISPRADSNYRIEPNKRVYYPGENANLVIKSNAITKKAHFFTLSIVPEFSYYLPVENIRKPDATNSTTLFYPETIGVTVSGRLVNKENGTPIPEKNVNLSIIGKKDFQAFQTDSNGQFFFNLPDYYGNRDLFLCAEKIDGINSELLIDNDFCTKPVALPSPPFSLNDEERNTAFNLAVNHKLNSVFTNADTLSALDYSLDEIPFYGQPTDILYLDKFIEMPSVEDYFNELSISAKVRKNQGKKIFRFYSSQSEMSIYSPLVLIDWVAVDDIDRVLSMSPKEIEHIELVNSPYVKGEIIYGGIISFVSKNKDFGGIDLPSSGTFLNYALLEPCHTIINQPADRNNVPDSRNTVAWEPNLELKAAEKINFTFTTPQTPGDYIIVLTELKSEGSFSYTTVIFTVSSK